MSFGLFFFFMVTITVKKIPKQKLLLFFRGRALLRYFYFFSFFLFSLLLLKRNANVVRSVRIYQNLCSNFLSKCSSLIAVLSLSTDGIQSVHKRNEANRAHTPSIIVIFSHRDSFGVCDSMPNEKGFIFYAFILPPFTVSYIWPPSLRYIVCNVIRLPKSFMNFTCCTVSFFYRA